MALASFIQRRMEEEGRNYYEVLDWFETPTPPHRMIFDVERCLMHFRFSTLEPQLSTVSWLKNRQGVRVDVREVNGEIIARKTAIASGCGAMKVEDIEVAQKALEDGSYKLLVLFKPVDQHENRFNDTVTIPRERDIRPARNYDYYNEEQLDFIDYFPDHKVIPLDVMGRLRME
ncbi:hypothetical protein BESB_026890 [Besnoitia besnoiti]|uniref:Uncharacterized protein n=1 Tax=Besnoitia besnoiti TaxID=94643 RepID=A0A2A9M156_BESBE|nr:uncharacterized protein BESB_026890 [Besnoitia besnoiti]PFH31715.1 hypothetical protein BESB_026890 [Besnoitia besnoiti]